MAESLAQARADRIREEVAITAVLEDLGYHVRGDADWREQQFSCNLHGDGFDNKPSARVYPETASWYCFACDLSRDAIATVQANNGLEFWPAVKWIEAKYGLPPLKWDGPKKVSTLDEVMSSLRMDKTFDDDLARAVERMDRLTKEKALPLRKILSFWEAMDKVVYNVRGPKGKGGPWSEKEGRAVLAKLQQHILEALKPPKAKTPT
jgi:hypothetical protein